MDTGEWTPWMLRSLSQPRLDSYAAAAGGIAEGSRLYWWNIEASGAFYAPLQFLEVALRNALHNTLRQKYARADWWSAAPLDPHGIRLVDKARQDRVHRSRPSATADDIVAGLSFGFWVKLLSSRHDRTFWVPTLHRAFPRGVGRRDSLHGQFNSMRELRNRISHQEPIHHLDLEAAHTTLHRLLGALDPELAQEVLRMDRTPTVLKNRQDTCAGLRTPQF
ncbi:hypothetical protein ACFVFS_20995 [Kitasatospora sp. NPDC057692]|uniref:hypothetical protein n=1 Tax=Kitasatospora sp. NPDC057692 TaxID=3346215 RepID=UPI0036CBB447